MFAVLNVHAGDGSEGKATEKIGLLNLECK